MSLGYNSKMQSKVWLLGALALASCSSTKSADIKDSDLDAASDTSLTDGLQAEGEQQTGAVVVAPEVEHAQYKGAHFPKVAESPFQQGGYWMNAYHFVRGKQTWEDLSRMIYDRADRASLLATWNPGVALAPGAVVYYNSPFRADDSTQMKNLAADFGIPMEKVVVQSGDWLSKIAGEKYGNVDSWREIASLNRDKLVSPDKIEVGMELFVLPAELNTKPILRAYVEKAKEVAQNDQIAGTVQNNNNDPGALSPDENKSLEGELDQATASNPAVPAPGDSLALEGNPLMAKVKKVLLANLTNLLMGLGLLIAFGGGLLFLRRRKKSKMVEKEITLNMDILEQTGTSRAGATSNHPMN